MMMKTEKRNTGIDLLRILSMFYVLILHSLKKGGVLDACTEGTNMYMAAWFLETWAYCAVNIFALISGYVSFHHNPSRFKISNYILLWFQVVFYGILVCLVCSAFWPKWVNINIFINSVFPLTNDLYWYFSAYTGLFILIPLLNVAIRQCSVRLLKVFFVCVFVFFALIERMSNPFDLEGGYSFAWIVLLYIMGAIIKKCEIGKKMKPLAAFIAIIVCCALSWGWYMLGVSFKFMTVTINGKFLISYVSPTILAIAVLHIIWLSKIRFPLFFSKIIVFMGSGAFAAYILNNNKIIWKHLMNERFAYLANTRTLEMLGTVLGFSILFVVLSILIDKGRAWLFHVARVDKLAVKIDDAVIKTIYKLFKA